jgi:hypothetical protein
LVSAAGVGTVKGPSASPVVLGDPLALELAAPAALRGLQIVRSSAPEESDARHELEREGERFATMYSEATWVQLPEASAGSTSEDGEADAECPIIEPSDEEEPEEAAEELPSLPSTPVLEGAFTARSPLV